MNKEFVDDISQTERRTLFPSIYKNIFVFEVNKEVARRKEKNKYYI